MKLDVEAVNSTLLSLGLSFRVSDEVVGPVVRCEQQNVSLLLETLRDSEFHFAMLLDMFGMDDGEKIEITYHLRSLSRDLELYVRCELDYDAELKSVWNVYPSALMPERETAELYGLILSGHPNPKRLLTTDGVPPLLRKSTPIRTAEEVRAR